MNEYPSTTIIINAANEVLVSEFLKKKMPFLTFISTFLKLWITGTIKNML